MFTERMKGFFKKMFYAEISLRDRLFRMIISMGMAAALVSVIGSICIGECKPHIIIPLIIGFFLLGLVLWVSCRCHKTELMTDICAVVVCFLLFPAAFFLSGGSDSGMSSWFVLAIVFIFLLFSGKKFIFYLCVTIALFLGAYYLSYLHPELVVHLDSLKEVYLDESLAFMIVSFVIGILIKFQIRIFENEKAVTEMQKARIEEISNSRNAFFANISHEIRTPINTIIGLNEMILREDVSDEIAENARNVQNAGKMLLALVNDILDMSKIESGKMKIIPENYKTADMFSDLVNIIWIRAYEKKLAFKVNISEELPSGLYGDEVRIKQMILNLLSNAVKYTESGSVTLTARSEALGNNKIRLFISVADTGIGIRKENKDALFSSFQRVGGTQTHHIEGTGLGLSITKQLVEMMGGQITVDSIYTKGSTFTLIFDQSVINEAPMGAFDFTGQNRWENEQKYERSFEASKARVLIVDDNEMNRLVAAKLLRATKVQIDTAASGEECLNKTLHNSYHVIFMDHKMPDMDGVETLKLLRKQEEGLCQNIPVIALTANAMNDAEQIYREYGFQEYLEKPVNGILLEKMLLRYLPEELVEYRSESPAAPDNSGHIAAEGRYRRRVCITTDCVCDLPQEWLEQLEIKNMYYYVHVNHARFCDGKEINSDNLMQFLPQEGGDISSEPAGVEEYEQFFADRLEEAERIIHISMASRASVGYKRAAAAASCFDNVTVVDSGHLSSGMGIAVLCAAKMAEERQSPEQILETLSQLKSSISTSFIVNSAESLYRGGKVTKTVWNLCEFLQLHPILEMSQSRICCHGFLTGSMEQAVKKYVRRQLRSSAKIDPGILFITNVGFSQKQLKMVAAEVEKYVHFERVVFQRASATISSNCGVGSIGLLFVKK